ncbi:MAG TPA: tetratricopeptide repeat protein [Polyangiaceae bacterium]
MRRNALFATLLTTTVFAVVLSSLVPASASAADKDQNAAPFHPEADPNNVTGLSQVVAIVQKGNEKYVAKDVQGAIDQYRKAIAVAPKNPLGHYALGVALVAAGNPQEAELSLKKAVELGEGQPATRARALFAIADLKDRQKKWEEAKTAWQAYADFVTKRADAGFAESGKANVEALDDMLKQDKIYEGVRDRVAAEKLAATQDAGTPKK